MHWFVNSCKLINVIYVCVLFKATLLYLPPSLSSYQTQYLTILRIKILPIVGVPKISFELLLIFNT